MVPLSANLIFGIAVISGDVLEKGNESSDYLPVISPILIMLTYPYPSLLRKPDDIRIDRQKDGVVLKEVNMSHAIKKFQSAYPKDPESVSIPPIRIDSAVIYLIIGIILSILIIGMILSMARRK